MVVIRISSENRAVDRSNQPNPKSFTLRKLALDKERYIGTILPTNMFTGQSRRCVIILVDSFKMFCQKSKQKEYQKMTWYIGNRRNAFNCMNIYYIYI